MNRRMTIDEELHTPGMGFNFSTNIVAWHMGSCKAPEPPTPAPLFRCNHCRSKFSNFGGSCPNCGSADSEVLWLPYQSSYFPRTLIPAY
jgi:hypothetical protein